MNILGSKNVRCVGSVHPVRHSGFSASIDKVGTVCMKSRVGCTTRFTYRYWKVKYQ